MRFDREGLGYVMALPATATELRVSGITRSRGELHGLVSVSCGLPGMGGRTGQLHRARFNLVSTTSRTTLAKVLTQRAPIPQFDWFEALEEFCSRVIDAESAGSPVVMVGARPQRLVEAWRMEPILAMGKPTILYGEGGSGKSTLAAAIAVSIETGVAVIPGWAPRRGSVLYLDWETESDDIDEMVKGIAAGANIPHAVEFRYRKCHGTLADQVEEVAALVTRDQVGLLIVDSVGMAAGTGGEGTDAAESALRLFGALRAIGTTSLLLDHVSKAERGGDRPASPYGSVYKTNLARSTFEIRRIEAGDHSILALYNTKTNVSRKLPPIGLEVIQEGGRIEYVQVEVPKPAPKGGSMADRAVAYIEEVGSRTTKELAAALEVDESSLRVVLNRDVRVEREGVTGWRLADAG